MCEIASSAIVSLPRPRGLPFQTAGTSTRRALASPTFLTLIAHRETPSHTHSNTRRIAEDERGTYADLPTLYRREPAMSTAPSSSSNLATALKVTGAVVGALAVATIGYAAVFDYRRRNDPAFRRKLRQSSSFLPGLTFGEEKKLSRLLSGADLVTTTCSQAAEEGSEERSALGGGRQGASRQRSQARPRSRQRREGSVRVSGSIVPVLMPATNSSGLARGQGTVLYGAGRPRRTARRPL